MFNFNFKYNRIIFFCILLLINGCQKTREKLIVENKISTKILQKDKITLSNKNFLKNKILKKSEVVLKNKEKILKQEDNNVVF